MRTHQPTELLLDTAQTELRCAVGKTDSQRRALTRRCHAGELVSPWRNIYARVEYWNSLTPCQRHLHTARALLELHPTWVFAGATAACAHGFEHGYSLHAGTRMDIVAPFSDISVRRKGTLQRILIPGASPVTAAHLPVTPVRRTLIDCAAKHSFRETLPIFDSAVRHGVTADELASLCADAGMDSVAVTRLCLYVDPLSENGGESFCRAVIIELGFVVPRLQREFYNPINPDAPYRCDFSWTLPDGSIVVVEYDGMAKYVMQDTRRSTIQEKVHAEREREKALTDRGVKAIARLDYDDLLHPERVERKLIELGVPKRRAV